MAPNSEVKLKKGRDGLGPAAEGAGLPRGHGGALAAAEPDPFTFATGRRRRRPLCIVGRAAPLPSPPVPGEASGLPLTGPAGVRVGAEGEWPRPRLTVGPSPAPPFCSQRRWFWLSWAPLRLLLPGVPSSLALQLHGPSLPVCRWLPPRPYGRFCFVFVFEGEGGGKGGRRVRGSTS